MINFDALDPETRCVALVGEFLRRWSEMEGAIHAALAVAMNLDDTMRAILCANIQFRDKLAILQTVVYVSTLEASEKERISEMLTDLSDYVPKRNLMAHTTFRPDENGAGVLFLPVKAKRKLSQPKEVWTAAQFADEYKNIDVFKDRLTELQITLSKSQFSLGNFIIEGVPLPMRRTMSPALLDFLSHQTPLPLRESQANPKKDV